MNIKQKLIYTAGYFDGDASFRCRKQLDKRDGYTRYAHGIRVTSVNPDIIYFFQNIYGGTIHIRKVSKIRMNSRDQYTLQIEGNNSNNLTKSLIPYLIEKKEEAQLLNKFVDHIYKYEKSKIIDQLKIVKHQKNLLEETDKQKILDCRNTIIPTKEDFIYLAGFIDAECCLSFRQKYPILYFNNTKAPIFYWIASRFGGYIYICKKPFSNRRLKFQWVCVGKSLKEILQSIFPYLQYKKRNCKIILEFMKTYQTTKKLPSDVIEKRSLIIQEIHKFNLVGLTSI
jgi:hypothetical protein